MALARSPVPTPASGLCHAACSSSKTRTATRHAKPSGSSHAQPLTVMPTVLPRFLQTPARHTCCWERRAASAPVPHAERREDAACSFTCPLPPSPAAPHEPCRTSSARLMQDPRRSRAHDAPQAAGRPDKSGLLGVAPRATSSILSRHSTGSFGSSTHGPKGRPTKSCGSRSCPPKPSA